MNYVEPLRTIRPIEQRPIRKFFFSPVPFQPYIRRPVEVYGHLKPTVYMSKNWIWWVPIFNLKQRMGLLQPCPTD